MIKLILSFFVASSLMGAEFNVNSVESLNIEDKTGTGIFEISFQSGNTKYYVNTMHTRTFVLEQCLQTIRTAMSTDLGVKIVGAGSSENLLIYGCQLKRAK